MKATWHKRAAKPVFDIVRTFYTPQGKKRSKFRFIGKFRVQTDEGLDFWLYNNHYHLETDIYWSGWDQLDWENTTRKVWTRLSRSANSILDIGANTGVFSVIAQAANPQAKIVAFEPQPNIYQVLETNNGINHFSMCCLNLALSDEAATLPFYNYGKHAFTSSNTTAGSLNQSWRQDNQQSIDVTVKRLDEVLAEQAIGQVDLIKIDVETFEFEVLKGYGSRLQQDRPVLILEIQDAKIGANVLSLFTDLDYRFFHIDEGTGLHQVTELSANEPDKNYLLCPVASVNTISEFIQ